MDQVQLNIVIKKMLKEEVGVSEFLSAKKKYNNKENRHSCQTTKVDLLSEHSKEWNDKAFHSKMLYDQFIRKITEKVGQSNSCSEREDLEMIEQKLLKKEGGPKERFLMKGTQKELIMKMARLTRKQKPNQDRNQNVEGESPSKT